MKTSKEKLRSNFRPTASNAFRWIILIIVMLAFGYLAYFYVEHR